MFGPQKLPVSTLLHRESSSGGSQNSHSSRIDYHKEKKLEEQRKAGAIPAKIDVETGRDINPHIPEFIEKTPWYIPASGSTLKHQKTRPSKEKRSASIKEWYAKGTSSKSTHKYREGGCENCGAMGHAKRQCMEKPRAVGAKYSNTNIAPDDIILRDLELDFDAKRDRWNGYDSSEYKKVQNEFEKAEEIRKIIKAQNRNNDIDQQEDGDDNYANDMSLSQNVDMDSQTRGTVRNLRIREDTANYLYNLDEKSAYYDPKSRSMRGNPLEDSSSRDKSIAIFAGDCYFAGYAVLCAGEVGNVNESQLLARHAQSQGIDINALAEPTKLETFKKEYGQLKASEIARRRQELLEKYGDASSR